MKITREQAITEMGIEAVEAVEAANCEPTSRLLPEPDNRYEWSASVSRGDLTLIAYYYTTPEDQQTMADHDGDGSYIDWTVDNYEII